MLHRFTIASNEGPRILWEQLKGKKVKTNDGHGVGEIKEIAQNYIRLEKGIVNKDKSWVPKYLVDAYDGKVLWLVISNDDLQGGIHTQLSQMQSSIHTTLKLSKQHLMDIRQSSFQISSRTYA
jgi:hypothetical protein